MPTSRFCTEAKGFDDAGVRYGLTCGYWTNVPKNLDNHVIKHHFDDHDLYDLTDEQYIQARNARKATVTTTPDGGLTYTAGIT